MQNCFRVDFEFLWDAKLVYSLFQDYLERWEERYVVNWSGQRRYVSREEAVGPTGRGYIGVSPEVTFTFNERFQDDIDLKFLKFVFIHTIDLHVAASTLDYEKVFTGECNLVDYEVKVSQRQRKIIEKMCKGAEESAAVEVKRLSSLVDAISGASMKF